VVLAAIGDTRCVVAAGAGVAAGLSAAGERVLLSGVVPGPRGIVAGQSGVVSSFLILLAIPAFDRIAGLYDRHLIYNRGICLR